MYIILVAPIHIDVNIKPSLYTHIIGFPYHTNSKNSNNVDSGKHEIGTAPDTSIYKPLYEISNKNACKMDTAYYTQQNHYRMKQVNLQ
jgi:hypothetical protein